VEVAVAIVVAEEEDAAEVAADAADKGIVN
jgi:hypothetical protein